MRRHSDSLRGANATTKEEKTHEQAFCAARVLSSRRSQKGGKREGERSEQESVVPC